MVVLERLVLVPCDLWLLLVRFLGLYFGWPRLFMITTGEVGFGVVVLTSNIDSSSNWKDRCKLLSWALAIGRLLF